MSPVIIRRSLNNSSVDHLLRNPTGGVARYLLRRGAEVESQAKRNLAGDNGAPKRIDTGRLRSSITHQLFTSGANLGVRIGTNVQYAYWIHEGTGVFGPRRRRIYPKQARYLRWRARGTGKYVYRKSVAGIKPNRFLVDALHSTGRYTRV